MSEMILIVDGDRDLTSTLEIALRQEGLAARSVHSGRQALELACAEPAPDLVLLEATLPDISGTQVCRQLREAERTRAMRVIMMTRKARAIDRVVGFEVGADDYIAKPFSVRELALRIRAVLRRGAPAPSDHAGLQDMSSRP